jgi:trimeric autotransporter adhesin
MLSFCGMDCNNYSNTLIGWSNSPLTASNLSLGANGLKYNSAALIARNTLISTKNWTILGDSLNAGVCCTINYINLNETSCNSYTWLGNTYTISGTYKDTFINTVGCDSIVTLNLTINNSNLNTITQSACNSYTWLGNIYTTTGIYKDTFINATGCDSIVTLNLTINNSNLNTITQSACNSYTWLGNIYTTTGIYKDTFINATGCDSIVSLNLTITDPNDSIALNNTTLTSLANNATYQWVSCPTYSPIAGANSKTYTAVANGDYACIVTQNGCIDTSLCETVTIIGLNNNHNTFSLNVYPNPTSNTLIIENPSLSFLKFEIQTTLGQKIIDGQLSQSINKLEISQLPAGVYLLKVINTLGKQEFIKVVKE